MRLGSTVTVAALLFVLVTVRPATAQSPFVVVLGTAQDAGYPQAGCAKSCCQPAWQDASRRRFATSLALIDPQTKQRWLIECTPDFKEQLRLLDEIAPSTEASSLDGILLTHAHIGHYAGLIHLGREVMGSSSVPIHVMPRMRKFLENNGPWSQLLQLENVRLIDLRHGVRMQLNERVSVTPLQVPHRDEFSETVGFLVHGPRRNVLFLPDIDKWEKWKTPVEDVIRGVDLAFVDGTFFANGEIPGRDMSLIPHPFIQESLARFARLPQSERSKVRFIHLNHTNPAMDHNSAAARTIRSGGCHLAVQGERHEL